MLQESTIDRSLNRLLAHFGKRVVVRPPATAAEIAELEATVGSLPRDLVIFLSTCNGLRVDLSAPDADTHLCCIHEIEAELLDAGGPPIPEGLLPLRGNPEGERDWLVLGPGPARDLMVRWDPWAPPALLLAASFSKYLDAWSARLVENFDEQGEGIAGLDVPAFDASYIAGREGSLARLQTNEEIHRWLHELDLAIPSGDDFE